MKQVFHEIEINTNGQKLYDFTSEVKKWIKKACQIDKSIGNLG